MQYDGFRRRLVTLPVVLLTAYSIEHAQAIRFDVKTAFEQKAHLRVIKHGVIHSIAASNWARVAEYGETHSLWLNGINRKVKTDSVHSILSVEIRTPAMVTRGQPVAEGEVVVSFAVGDAEQYADPVFVNSYVARQQSNVWWFSQATRLLMSGYGFGYSAFAQQVIRTYGAEFGNEPQPWEVMEATLLGARTMASMAEYFQVTEE